MTKIKKHKQISYQLTEGEKIPLIFIHGFCEDRSIWEQTITNFPGHRILAPDLPGFGDSEPVEDLSIEKAAMLIGEIIRKEGIKEYLLFGHSMGGYISLALAEKDESVKGLGLIHSHPFVDSPEKKEGRLKAKEFVRQHGSLPFVKQLIPSLFSKTFVDREPAMVNRLIERAGRYAPSGIMEALDAMRKRPDRSHILEKASFPVLFVIGKEDQAIPEEYSLKQTGLPDIATIRIVEKAGHMAQFESPAEFQAVLTDFIRYCRP